MVTRDVVLHASGEWFVTTPGEVATISMVGSALDLRGREPPAGNVRVGMDM
jgi:hypothetical protein